MPARVLQFGTSRFLQAHADLFIHQARSAGQDIGPIAVVKTTTGLERAGRVQAFADPAGFPVMIRGFQDGKRVDSELRVQSVTRALDAARDWPALLQIFAKETEVVICNTGEAGFAVTTPDHRRPLPDAVPSGYPAKLLQLLTYRFANGAAPLLILPCELISNNGQELRRTLAGLASDWALASNFTDWLNRSVTICDTLVDRIVSQALEPVGAVAEPYGLWAIRREPGLEEPFQHPNVVYTDDLTPYLRLKLHILNLGHTWLADMWLTQHRAPDETVRVILSDATLRTGLLSLYRDEVIPGFAAQTMADAATLYVAQTVERFDNPFLNHRLSDIAQNHTIKITNRVRAFVDWVHGADPALSLPRLEKLARVAE